MVTPIPRKCEVPQKEFPPSPQVRPKPRAQYTMAPRQVSSQFLMRMLTVFFDLTAPASKKAKPHCMKKTMMPRTARKKWSTLVFL